MSTRYRRKNERIVIPQGAGWRTNALGTYLNEALERRGRQREEHVESLEKLAAILKNEEKILAKYVLGRAGKLSAARREVTTFAQNAVLTLMKVARDILVMNLIHARVVETTRPPLKLTDLKLDIPVQSLFDKQWQAFKNKLATNQQATSDTNENAIQSVMQLDMNAISELVDDAVDYCQNSLAASTEFIYPFELSQYAVTMDDIGLAIDKNRREAAISEMRGENDDPLYTYLNQLYPSAHPKLNWLEMAASHTHDYLSWMGIETQYDRVKNRPGRIILSILPQILPAVSFGLLAFTIPMVNNLVASGLATITNAWIPSIARNAILIALGTLGSTWLVLTNFDLTNKAAKVATRYNLRIAPLLVHASNWTVPSSEAKLRRAQEIRSGEDYDPTSFLSKIMALFSSDVYYNQQNDDGRTSTNTPAVEVDVGFDDQKEVILAFNNIVESLNLPVFYTPPDEASLLNEPMERYYIYTRFSAEVAIHLRSVNVALNDFSLASRQLIKTYPIDDERMANVNAIRVINSIIKELGEFGIVASQESSDNTTERNIVAFSSSSRKLYSLLLEWQDDMFMRSHSVISGGIRSIARSSDTLRELKYSLSDIDAMINSLELSLDEDGLGRYRVLRLRIDEEMRRHVQRVVSFTGSVTSLQPRGNPDPVTLSDSVAQLAQDISVMFSELCDSLYYNTNASVALDDARSVLQYYSNKDLNRRSNYIPSSSSSSRNSISGKVIDEEESRRRFETAVLIVEDSTYYALLTRSVGLPAMERCEQFLGIDSGHYMSSIVTSQYRSLQLVFSAFKNYWDDITAYLVKDVKRMDLKLDRVLHANQTATGHVYQRRIEDARLKQLQQKSETQPQSPFGQNIFQAFYPPGNATGNPSPAVPSFQPAFQPQYQQQNRQ